MQASSLRLMLLSGLGASLVACGGGSPDPTTVRQGVSQNLSQVLPEIVAALDSDASARVPLDSARRVFELFDASTDAAPAALVARASALQALTVDSTLDSEELSQWLATNLFSDANHQGDGVFVIPAAALCGPADPLDEEAADCAAQVAKLEPKLKVRGDADDLEFSLLLGPSSNEPFSLELTRSSIDFRVDLGELDQTVHELAQLFDGTPPNLRASGRVALGLSVKGPQHVVFKSAIEKAVEVAFAGPGVSLDSAEATRLSSASATVFSLDLDGQGASVKGALALGTTKLHAPAGATSPMIDLDLPGLTGTLTVTAGEPVKLTGLSLGDRSLTIDADGVRAATVDLNPEAGRSFDVVVTETAGEAALAFSPMFDLRLNVDGQALGNEPAPFQVTRVLLDGTAPTLSSRGGVLEVTSGHLLVTTDPAGFGVEANAGQCVTETPVSGSTSRLEVTACPL